VPDVTLRPRAERDLRQIGPGPERSRIVARLRELGSDAANLDIKALAGAAPWLRLRVGDYRVRYRPAGEVLVFERIVHRRDLDRAVDGLPAE
jgi:mRNA-degrading endonuclease RelE of RelBE toxin-antitoxin system